jgi:hypothetical protein
LADEIKRSANVDGLLYDLLVKTIKFIGIALGAIFIFPFTKI